MMLLTSDFCLGLNGIMGDDEISPEQKQSNNITYYLKVKFLNCQLLNIKTLSVVLELMRKIKAKANVKLFLVISLCQSTGKSLT